MRWISVKERLPELVGGNYCVLGSDGEITFDVIWTGKTCHAGFEVWGCCGCSRIDNAEYWINEEDVVKYFLSLPKSPSENAPSPGSETLESDNLSPDTIIDFEYSLSGESFRFKGRVDSWVKKDGDDYWFFYVGSRDRAIELLGAACDMRRYRRRSCYYVSAIYARPFLDQRGKDMLARCIRALQKKVDV